MTIDIPEGYEALGLALGEAVAQAARGKGADRHAESGEKFSDQLIMSIPKRLGPGGECFCLGQALKKICESRRLPQARARAELLGAINYLAAAWCLLGGRESVFAPDGADALRAKEWASRQIARNGTVSAPEPPKAAGNVCLGFAERVVSLMKEAGVREVSFANPGARICADGTVTGLHFTTEDADAPRTKGELFRRIREANPAVYPQEDCEAPLFSERTPVECRPPLEAEWTPAFYIGVDPQGFHVVERGDGLRMHLSADAVRKPEDADKPRFQTGELVEFRPRDGKWRPAAFDCMDGNFAVVVSKNEKFRVPACDVRPAEKS